MRSESTQTDGRDFRPAGAGTSSVTGKPGRRILIGICSCHRYAEKRAAVWETWLNELPSGIAARFFVGAGSASLEPDVISLAVDDDYAGLPKKVQGFFRYALAHDEFEYLFKCDDDTFVFCERLFELLKDGAEFIGSADFWPGHADGGAGYLLSRRAVQTVVEAMCPDSGPEDVWVTRAVRNAGIELVASEELVYDYRRLPYAPARVITAHHCPPEILREIRDWLSRVNSNGVSISCYARHSAWRGPITLLPNGFFIGGGALPNGRWEFGDDRDLLIIRWFDWPKDLLRKTATGYSNSQLQLDILGPDTSGRFEGISSLAREDKLT